MTIAVASVYPGALCGVVLAATIIPWLIAPCIPLIHKGEWLGEVGTSATVLAATMHHPVADRPLHPTHTQG